MAITESVSRFEFADHPIMKLYLKIEDYYKDQYKRANDNYKYLVHVFMDARYNGCYNTDPDFYDEIDSRSLYWFYKADKAQHIALMMDLERRKIRDYLKAQMETKNENAQEGEA